MVLYRSQIGCPMIAYTILNKDIYLNDGKKLNAVPISTTTKISITLEKLNAVPISTTTKISVTVRKAKMPYQSQQRQRSQ